MDERRVPLRTTGVVRDAREGTDVALPQTAPATGATAAGPAPPPDDAATGAVTSSPELLAQSVLDALPSRTAVVSSDGIIVAVNRAWLEFALETEADLARTCIGADYLAELRRAMPAVPSARQALMGLEGVLHGQLHSFEMDYDVAAPDAERTFGATMVPLPDGGAVISHDDITWRKSLERQLSFRATHDTLTGLPNRFLLTDRLLQALNRAVRSRRMVGVLFCDLDQFKVLNDTLGHAAGDQVLVSVARRIERVCRSTDSVTRFGGDEFVIVVEDVPDLDTLREIAERLRESITSPISVDGTEMWFGVSIGAVVTEGTTRATPEHVEGLLRDADTAMYQAKEAGRNRISVFDQGMRDKVATRMALTMSLRNAVARGEMRLDYQPIFSLIDDRAVGAEALVRWDHPQQGLVPPSDFIQAAEESGIIIEIGAWVLDQACRRASTWEAAVGRPFSVAVNLSPKQLQHPALVSQVAEALSNSGLAGARLMLEITEGSLMREPEVAEETLVRLKRLGVRIAVDDFGTGYSSLSYLQRFPVDVLKVDRTFVSRITVDPRSAALVGGIVSLARAIDLETVAEGVETEAQRRTVRDLGCDRYQGYLRARPMPAAALEDLLRGEHLLPGR